jgi:hypothetical protein
MVGVKKTTKKNKGSFAPLDYGCDDHRHKKRAENENIFCCNPSLGLATKARGCKVVSQEKDLGVISHVPGSAKSVRE